MKVTINCPIHGEVPFHATPDFFRGEAVTMYCPRCAEETASETNAETALDHCRRIKEKYKEVRRQPSKRPEGGYTSISRDLWFIIEDMLIDKNLWENIKDKEITD